MRAPPPSFLVLFLSVTTALAQSQIFPVDETTKEKTFAEFKEKLIGAVEKRDASFIESIIASDAIASFGGDRGVEGFHRTYSFKDPNAPFWRELQEVLALGGAFGKGRKEFTAPYVGARWPEETDAIDHVALIASDVPVREAPGEGAKELTKLSYSIVEVVSDSAQKGDESWIKVWLPVPRNKVPHADGAGFVPASTVRSALNYRAQFRKDRGVWKLASFVAGD